MQKKSFILYTDYLTAVSRLSDNSAGRLFKAILSYAATGDEPKLCAEEQMAFYFIKGDLDRAAEKYRAVCEKRREAGRKGGMSRRESPADTYRSLFD